MRFSSAPLATAVALASIVCLATTPVEAKSPDKGQHNSHSERSLHKHKGEKDEAQALWNNGHHHHHHRSKHHKKNKHHKSKYENGKCPRKGKGVCVNLVCDGTVIDELYCPKGSKSPAFNVSDIGAQYNGGGGYKRYVVMQPPCSNKLPPSCEPVADALVSDDSQDDVDDDYIADGDADAEKDGDTGADDGDDGDIDAESPPAEMPDGLSEEEQSLRKKKHHHHKHHHHGNNGHSHPYKDLCVAVGKFCGDQLFGCDFPKINLYFCKEVGKPPVKIPDVKNQCSGEPSACTCPSKGEFCSSEFPKFCALKKDTVYTCNGKGAFPEETTTKCVATSCKCPSKGELCGSTFPDACSLKKDTVYTCRDKGARPEETKAKCVPEECKCSAEGEVCGSDFPDYCNLKNKTIYICSEKGALPEEAIDTCVPDECRCPSSGEFCSSLFPGLCNLKNDTIYTCSNPEALPEETIDKCVPDECKCSASGEFCSSTFPDICNLKTDTIYTCTAIGVLPGATNDKCVPEECKCPAKDVYCSNQFDEACQLTKDTIYTCNERGALPTETTDKCTPNECTCTAAGTFCGTVFPATCNYTTNAVYRCSGVGAAPVIEKDCTADGSKVCTPRSINESVCVAPECTCKTTGTICSSQFPQTCGYTANSVYRCNAIGAVPEAQQDCGAGTCVTITQEVSADGTQDVFAAADAICAPPCTCTSNQDICASAFPSVCGYGSTSLLRCEGPGSTPAVKEACRIGCETVSGINRCIAEPAPTTTTHAETTTTRADAGTPVETTTTEEPTTTTEEPATTTEEPATTTEEPTTTTEEPTTTTEEPTTTTEEPTTTTEEPTTTTEEPTTTTEEPTTTTEEPTTTTEEPTTTTEEPTTTTEEPTTTTEEPTTTTEESTTATPTPTTDCSCTGTTDVCGSTFPAACRLSADTLYSCSAVGAAPTVNQVCQNGCLNTTTPHTCKDCTAAATEVINQLQALLTGLEGVATVIPGAKPALDIITNTINTILTQAAGTLLADQAAAASAAQQVISLVTSLVSSFSNFTLPGGTPDPFAVVTSTLTQLTTVVNNLATCAGGTSACDITTSILSQVSDIVTTQVQAITATFPIPFLGEFIGTAIVNATQAIEEGLTTLSSATIGLALNQLQTLAGLLSSAIPVIGDGPYAAVLALQGIVEAALACSNVTPPTDTCTFALQTVADLITQFLNAIKAVIDQVPGVSFISTPIFTAFETAKDALVSGVTATATDAVAVIEAGFRFLLEGVVPLLPPPLNTIFAQGIQAILDIINGLGGCVGDTNPCTALFQIAANIINAALDLLDPIPGAEVLTAPIQGLVTALQSGAQDVIATAVGLVKTPLDLLVLVPIVGNNPVLKALQSALDTIASCVN